MNPFIPTTSPTDSALQSWWHASALPAVEGALEALHEYAAHAAETHRPVCLSSGKCCNFRKHEHILVVTGLEALWVWRKTARTLGSSAADAARSAGVCGFLSGSLCTIHSVRPTGCRTYFCDRGEASWQSLLSERLHQSIISLHTEHKLPYLYAEWTWLISQVTRAEEQGIFSGSIAS